MKTIKFYYTIASLLTLITISGLWALPEAPNAQATDKELRKAWKKKYPTETIIQVESGGENTLLEKTNAAGKVVETKLKVPFWVTVTKKNKRKFKYEIGVNYKLIKNRWIFSELGVGQAEELVENDDRPAKAEVKKIFAAQLVAEKWQGRTVENMKMDDGTFAGGKYRYEGDYEVTGGAAKVTCNDFMMILFKDQGAWKAEIFSKGSCNE